MEKKNKIVNRKNEKGAITLYVLIACLFFMFILSGIYISNLNKLQAQEENIKQIQENYERELGNIGEVYENATKNLKATLTQEPKNDVWTNEKVILTGTGKVDRENNDATIVGYQFVKDNKEEPTEWLEVNNQIEIVKTKEVEENGTYYFWVKDSQDDKRVAKLDVSNIDKNTPISGELGGKEYENGEELGEYAFGTSTDKDVYVYIKDQGSDEESEVETSYEVKKLGSTDPIGKYTDPTTLTETGTYEITLTTKDKAENKVEKKYTVIIDRRIPVLSLKHNDENGANYESGTWTKDDLYGEIDIDMTGLDKQVEKYQYSYNGVIWNDVAEGASNSIDYTSTFPMGVDKPEWISQLHVEKNSEERYYFEEQADGTLKPNNTGINGKTANSYFEIDLTDYLGAELEITVNATISSESGKDIGYATITESITSPSYDSSRGRFIYISGETTTSDYKTTIKGGKKYYLHIGYSKDASTSSNDDTFIINNIKLKLQQEKEEGTKYTTAFPMNETKPNWISELINGDETNHFEVQEDGTLKSNNAGKDETTANSYFEIDLTGQENKKLEIAINATISSESSYDWGYATITESADIPSVNNEVGRFIYESGDYTSDYTTTITGGKKYYLHIGYSKDSSQSYNSDEFIINSMSFKLKELETTLDYTTTFPMNSTKPNWITGAIQGDNEQLNIEEKKYFFETQADGTLKPNNTGINSSVAHGYFEIDLTDYPETELEIILNATISSESGYDYGYAIINETIDNPSYSTSTGRFIYASGGTNTSNYPTTVKGGKKYYLHIGYRKDGSSSSGQDTFIINSIRLKSDELAKVINFYDCNKIGNKVTFKLKDEVDEEIYIRAVYTGDNKVTKYGDKTSIKIDKTAPIANTEIIMTSKTDVKLDVKAVEEASGLKEYYISTEEITPTESSGWIEQSLKEFTIENVTTNTTYYLWLIDNAGNISEKQTISIVEPNYLVDETYGAETLEKAILLAKDGSRIKLLNDYVDESVATFNKTNIVLDIQGYTLTRNKTITININKIVEITGTGKITNGENKIDTITNSGKITTSNEITIENNSTGNKDASIYMKNNSNAVANINDKSKIIGYYIGIYHGSGTININGGKIEAVYNSSSSYGIYNFSSGSYKRNINIKGGEIKGYNGIYNSSNDSIVEITGGKVIGTGAYGIGYGTINVYGGRVEGKTYGIVNNDTNKITIGKEEEELSIRNPAIYGGNYGIYMYNESNTFNFYNGEIISNAKETAYRGVVNPRIGYMPYAYFDTEIEQKYCTILVPVVENIEMEANPTEYTNGNVTVKIKYPYEAENIKQYSEDGIKWEEAKQYIKELIIPENKIIYARTINKSGIITKENQIEINNIDKEKPVVIASPEQTNYIVVQENDTVDIPITIKATDIGVSGLDIMKYAWAKEGEEPQYIDFNNEITLNKTKLKIGQYDLYLKVTDKAGNVADLERIRYNIRLQEPVCRIGDTKYLTIQEAIEACAKDAIRVEYNQVEYITTFPMSTDRPEIITEPIKGNDTYYFEVQSDGTLKPNNKGQNSTTANSCFEIDLTNYPEAEIEITINSTISSEKNYDFGYATVTESKDVPAYNQTEGRFIYVSGTTTTENHSITLTGGKKYYLHLGYRKDSGGASNNDTFIINSIKLKGNLPTLIVEPAATITMLKDTDEEFTTYEGQNIVLDLQGKTIGSSNQEKPICTNNGTLQIIDTSEEQTGKLESINGTAIYNTTTGTITIGDNSTSIFPEMPTIYGKKIGIKTEGILNFYDGKIQGISPTQGKITDTPEGYGPVSTNYENGITTVQLGIVSGYEARIEWVYYTTVQEAIDATRIDKKETVTILKNIQLNETIQINPTQNIILDLYKYELTIVPEKDKVIKNYGRLEITDSSEEQTGEIKIASTKLETVISVIYNDGELKVARGNINNDGYAYDIDYFMTAYNTRQCAIYNIGKTEIIGGMINTNSRDNHFKIFGIYNDMNGNITVKEGKISSGRNTGDSYGIYNNSTGKVKVEGGIISNCNNGIYSNSTEEVKVEGGTINGNAYGIYNNNTGKIAINGGTINCRFCGISNSTGYVIIEGGTINSSSSSGNSSGIHNQGTGNVKVKGGAISCIAEDDSYGIHNQSTGNVIVEGGIISSKSTTIYLNYNSYGIYNESTGSITIGKENEEIVTQDRIIIEGEHTGTSEKYTGYGVYNRYGNVEFYDGIIKGKNAAVRGNITRIKEGYKIENTIVQEKDAIYLVKETTNKEYIVELDEKKYYTLQEAIDSINSNEQKEIRVLKNFQLEENIIFNKNIVLDLKGYTITNKFHKIENTSELKITDTTENKDGKIESIETICGIINQETGNIKIDSGAIEYNGNDKYCYVIYNNGNTEINSGNIRMINSHTYYNYGIFNNSKGQIVINGGTVSGADYGIDSIGNIKVTGGTIDSYYEGIRMGNSGNLIIEGGTINSTRRSDGYGYGVYNDGIGNIIIFKGGIINSSGYGIYNYSKDGNVTVEGGTIRSDRYGIYNHWNGNVTIEGGTIISSSNNNTYGIYNESTGNIIIGIKGDGLVSQEEPNIKGEYTGTSSSNKGYGIYNTIGKLYYYDGKIEGSTKAIYDTITEIEERTELNYNEDETILTLSTELLDVAQIGDVKYKILQEAINIAEEKDVIKILRNVTYTKQEKEIIIPNNKDIILDLNGYKITSAIPEKTIQNEGRLEIIDTSESQTGLIVTSEETTIKNISGAQLTISGGKIENRTKQVIYNEGILDIKSGTISRSFIDNSIYEKDSYVIYNKSAGEVKIEGGTISNNTGHGMCYGIYNESTGNVTIEGGTISSISGYDGSYGIYNGSTGNIKIEGGTINSRGYYSTYGIYNESTGNIIVEGGTISSSSSLDYDSGWSKNSYGIYNKSIGKVIIGIKGDEIISQENPNIKGTYINNSSNNAGYGISSIKGEILYYDGIIQGRTRAIQGNIVEVEDKTELVITSETVNRVQYETIRLEEKEKKPIIINEIEYNTIQQGIKASGETENIIKLTRDVDPSETIIIEENQKITIDLNGYTMRNYPEITNNGTLKIIDTSESKIGKITGLSGIAITNRGRLELKEGSIVDTVYGIRNIGETIVDGGKVENNTYGIYNDTKGNITIKSAIITSNTYGVYNYTNSSAIYITGGRIQNNEYGIYIAGGNADINSNITGGEYGVYNSGGTTNIKEGVQINSKTGVYNANGTVNIGEQENMNPESPVIIGEKYGLVNKVTVNMYDGQIKGKQGATQGYITNTETGYAVANKIEGEYFVDYLALAGTITTVAQVNGIDYSNLQSAINSIVGEEQQTIKLTNGIITTSKLQINEGQNIILDMNGKTISSDLEITLENAGSLTIIDTAGSNVAKISSSVGTAIKNTGTLTLGQDDGAVGQELITIEGTTGIENSGTLNFYDGIITGASALTGTITTRPEGYVIRTTTVNGKERYYLST